MKYIYCSPTSYVNVRSGCSTNYSRVCKAYRADEIVDDWAPGTTFWRGVELANGQQGYVYIDYVKTWKPMLVGDMFGSSTLRGGSTGTYVRNLQRCLISEGYLGGTIDGIFGTNTENAVKDYQAAKSLTVDGKVGAATKNALYHECYGIFDADHL